jgi:hypothetical protein
MENSTTRMPRYGTLLDEPLGSELPERLAHRRLTDALLDRQALLPQPLARLEPPLQDLATQAIRNP